MTNCKNCNANFEGKYCNQCGQKNYTDKDKSIKHIIEEAFHFLTHFEGTFFTTLKAVLTKPSKLTIEYTGGIRKKYFKPISFFFLVVIIYLLFPLFKGLNMEMKYYKSIPFIGEKIEMQIAKKASEQEITIPDLSQKFENKSKITSKICLFLFIPFSVLLFYLLFPYKNKLLFDKIILATEINIFYLLVFYLIFPLIYNIYYTVIKFFFGLSINSSEVTISLIFTSVFIIYCSYIFKKIYHEKRFSVVLKGIVFTALHAFFMATLYRYIVFELIYIQI